MASDPNRPEKLLSVANEIESAAMVTALAEYGVEAFAAGGYTSGFKAEAPGTVAVLVKQADLDRATQALAEIRQRQDEIDWDNVDVMEGAEEEPPANGAAGAESLRRPVTCRLWLVILLVVVLIGAIFSLFTGYDLPLGYGLPLMDALVGLTVLFVVGRWLYRFLAWVARGPR